MRSQVHIPKKKEKRKRHAIDSSFSSTSNSAKKARSTTQEPVLDIAEMLGHRAGDRFEIKWIIQDDDSGKRFTHWWAATLLPHDGRTEDTVAIRVLEYDPYRKWGFPRKSKEDVLFLSKNRMVNPSTDVELSYRPLSTA